MIDYDITQAQRIIKEIKHELEVLNSDTNGWTKVDLPRGYKNRYDAIDIEIWVDENLGDFKKYGRTFFFKDEKDATMFLLRYS
jgi:hypothetical protein